MGEAESKSIESKSIEYSTTAPVSPGITSNGRVPKSSAEHKVKKSQPRGSVPRPPMDGGRLNLITFVPLQLRPRSEPGSKLNRRGKMIFVWNV